MNFIFEGRVLCKWFTPAHNMGIGLSACEENILECVRTEVWTFNLQEKRTRTFSMNFVNTPKNLRHHPDPDTNRNQVTSPQQKHSYFTNRCASSNQYSAKTKANVPSTTLARHRHIPTNLDLHLDLHPNLHTRRLHQNLTDVYTTRQYASCLMESS